jgi:hypothetical protein
MKPTYPGFEDDSTYMENQGVAEPQNASELHIVGFFSYGQRPPG